MASSRRGAVYWATLAFGGVFLAGSMGGEIVYYKYFRDERSDDLKRVSSFFESDYLWFIGERRRDETCKNGQ